jgi:hypothetical protein
VVQTHDLAVDRRATEAAVRRWLKDYDRRVEAEVAELEGKATAVLGDVPPLAFAAAHVAGVPSFALASFSWDWIYERMGLAEAATGAAEAYARATLLLELEPAAPMPAFPRRIDVGIVGRTPHRDRHRIRETLGVEPQERLVLLAFREPSPCALPPPSFGVRYVWPEPRGHDRADVLEAAAPFIDLVAAADVVVARAGYGILGDTAACGTPLLFVLREGFPEDDVLATWLADRPATHRLDAARLASGQWLAAVEELMCTQRPQPAAQDRVEAGVEALARVLRG